jgi:hypothetical protein
MGVHLLQCAYDNEWIKTRDVMCHLICIIHEVNFHVRLKWWHVFLLATLNYFWQCYPFQGWSLHFSQCCLIGPTCTNLFPPSCFTWKFTILEITSVKEKSYHDQHLINQFFPFAIEVLKCCMKKRMIFCMITPMQLQLWKD